MMHVQIKTSVICGTAAVFPAYSLIKKQNHANTHIREHEGVINKITFESRNNSESNANIFLYKFVNKEVYYTIGDEKMNVIMLSEIKYGKYVLNFKNKYYIPYFYEHGAYYADDSNLGIYAAGLTLEELKEDIQESICLSWELYVNCDVNELSADAIEFKNQLLSRLEITNDI